MSKLTENSRTVIASVDLTGLSLSDCQALYRGLIALGADQYGAGGTLTGNQRQSMGILQEQLKAVLAKTWADD